MALSIIVYLVLQVEVLVLKLGQFSLVLFIISELKNQRIAAFNSSHWASSRVRVCAVDLFHFFDFVEVFIDLVTENLRLRHDWCCR